MEKGRLLEPKSPSGQNASLRAGIEKETEGLTLVYTLHSPPAIPLSRLHRIGFRNVRGPASGRAS
jgi:hypothetical protein